MVSYLCVIHVVRCNILFIIVCRIHFNLSVVNVQFISTLPTRSSQPFGIAFHPTQSLLLVAYADRMVCCMAHYVLFNSCYSLVALPAYAHDTFHVHNSTQCSFHKVTAVICCLQCFDTVGWASGRASGL